MAPFESEASLYKAADMVPAYRGFWKSETAVNWKAVRDVDNEGYHVPMAHPGLQDLYGQATSTRYSPAAPIAPSGRSMRGRGGPGACRSEEHTSELQSLMRITYAVFCLKNKTNTIAH